MCVPFSDYIYVAYYVSVCLGVSVTYKTTAICSRVYLSVMTTEIIFKVTLLCVVNETLYRC